MRLFLVAMVLAPLLPWRALVAQDAGGARSYPDKMKLLLLRDEAGREQPITTAGQWRTRRAHILANMQQVMGPLPGPERCVALEPALSEPRRFDKYQQHRISFATEPGDRVTGYLLVPHGADKRPAVLCLHQTTKAGSASPAGLADRPTLHYAKELAERGYVTLSVDYPNFGEYRFDPYQNGFQSATMKGIWNHLRAIDLLQSLPEVDGKRIGVVGHSLGGHNSLFVAAFDERITCVVSSCGFCRFARYYGGDLTGWSHKGYMPRIAEVYEKDPEQMPFDFTEVVAAIAPRAFLAVAPQRDANFDVGGVRECISAARPVFELLGAADRLAALYPDAEHDFPDAERQRAYEWFDRWLGAPPVQASP